MAYKLKPNYHFASLTELGIDKVPIGRFIVIEDYGPLHEVKWFKKTTNNLRDSQGNIIGVLSSSTTIGDAITYKSIESPLDAKRNVEDSYSSTEIDSMLTTKVNSIDVYLKDDCDDKFRTIIDSYNITEVDSIIDGIKRNDSGIYQHANVITTSSTIENYHNAFSVGPIVLSNGIIITIPNGSVWQLI